MSRKISASGVFSTSERRCIIGSVIVVPSVRFECRNPNLSENHGDHLKLQLHHPMGHDPKHQRIGSFAFQESGSSSANIVAPQGSQEDIARPNHPAYMAYRGPSPP